MNKLPQARTRAIAVQSLGKEILIYNLNTHKAFNLNETSSIVYRACDGETTFEELKIKNKFTKELIFLALDELKKENLIEDQPSWVSPFSGMSRREAIRKAGLVSMIALPVISSLVAPRAAAAASVRCINPAGASAGTTVSTTTTNPSNDTTTNQNFAATFLTVQCCSNSYRNFISDGCSSGIGNTCQAQAVCN